MRFDRFPKASLKTDRITPRRLAAARRAVAKDKEKYGLFPELVQFKSAEERVEAWANGAADFWQDQRDWIIGK